jgi:Na+/H+ antiporter NhaA/predicted DsbA family dithiol-disulfide isomerase
MAIPVGIYLVLNAGHSSASGWGAVMSTDTALALGMLAVVGPRVQVRTRAFLLTVFVVDDIASFGVIALAYSERIRMAALLVALGLFCVVLLVRAAGVHHGAVYLVLGVGMWVALFESGIEPVLTGLVMGMLAYAYPASRSDLERATDLVRRFREQPTPELARSARLGVGSAISPNERLHLIVPVFALANAGVVVTGDILADAFTSPITLGILIGYVVGKPVGIFAATWLTTRLSRGRIRPPVGWAAVAGGGATAGIGFTLSLLIATLAFTGRQLEDAKIGILCAALCAAVLSGVFFRIIASLPPHLRSRALLGKTDAMIDLGVPVDPARDHLRGPHDAPVTVVEYGDFECPFCGQAEPVLRELLAESGDVRYVWRHLPLNDVHPRAQLAAEAAEAADMQGAFWQMHDLLLDHQDDLKPSDLVRYADALGLDVDRFREDLRSHTGAARVAEDIDSADLSEVSGTPTFFVNGQRHHGEYDIAALSTAVRLARIRAGLAS